MQLQNKTFYSASEICSLLKIARSTLSLWLVTKGFPQPIKNGSKHRLWITDEVDAWINANLLKVEKRDDT